MKTITEEKQPLRFVDDRKTLSDYHVTLDTHIILRDMGPQIGYRAVSVHFPAITLQVFFYEYVGPLAIMLLLFMRPSFIYGECSKVYSKQAVLLLCVVLTHRLAVAAWPLHYAKRLFETFFVHKFSHGTMPLTNLFKNCAYYWGYTLFVGYSICHPLYTPQSNMAIVYAAFAGMFICECVNGAVHLQFSSMRKGDGSQERPIPMALMRFVRSCVGTALCVGVLPELHRGGQLVDLLLDRHALASRYYEHVFCNMQLSSSPSPASCRWLRGR